ncbi:MAG: hypothetical protein ACC742_09445 [Thermoanaerobaculales bacterium]
MRIMVLTDDQVGRAMAGSALRAWELARALDAAGHTVRVAAAAGSVQPDGHGPEVVAFPPWRWSEALVAPPWRLPPRAFIGDHLLIVDGVTPLLAELDAMPPSTDLLRRRRRAAARLPLVAARADAVLIAGEEQAAWWAHQLRPGVPLLEVPFGIPDNDPAPEYDQIAGVPEDWSVVLWWGGVWPWLDLETLLAARARLGRARISLVVPTADRPGTAHTRFSREDLLSAARRHDLRAPQVVALEDWIPYAERHRVLNRSSLLAVLHQPGAEAELSFRTRALDGVWARVPLLLSEGGTVARIAREQGWGGVVRPGDPATVAAALDLMLTDREQHRCRSALDATRRDWRWSMVTGELTSALPELPAIPRNALAPAAVRAAVALKRRRHE